MLKNSRWAAQSLPTGNFAAQLTFWGPQPEIRHMREYFRQFAREAACAMGSSWAFFVACAVVLAWAVTGSSFNYSDTWQLVINTGTTIVTFLMVFLIQATQNRDSQAIQLKLDELLRAIAKARTGLVGLEHLSEDEIKGIEAEFAAIKVNFDERAKSRAHKNHGRFRSS